MHTEAKMFDSEAVIVATGGRSRQLSRLGSIKFEDKRDSLYMLFDGSLCREKRVTVIGGGKRVLRNPLFLTNFASEVSILGNQNAAHTVQVCDEESRWSPKIEIRPHAEVTAITSNDVVTAIELFDPRSERESAENVDGALMRLGSRPNLEFMSSDIETADTDHVTVDGMYEMSEWGVRCRHGMGIRREPGQCGDRRWNHSVSLGAAVSGLTYTRLRIMDVNHRYFVQTEDRVGKKK